MTDDGRMNLAVSLLYLAGLGLAIAGLILAPDSLPAWLLGGAVIALSWALQGYRAAARKRLDPRRSEQQPTITYQRRDHRP